jgi:hypothetical protein
LEGSMAQMRSAETTLDAAAMASRRRFMKTTLAAGGALVTGIALEAPTARAASAAFADPSMLSFMGACGGDWA